ncbi:MAG: carbonic anhydrase [Candidatus Gastranaerophilales bacterium]
MTNNEFNIPDGIPEAARNELESLLTGNKNFINGTPTLKNMCLATLQKHTLYQAPYACVLTCSDSRVVPEIIFDCGFSELFVVRVAGMTTGPNIIESVEYAVKSLGVSLVILLGHDDCGVMKSVNDIYPAEPDNYKSIIDCVYPVFRFKNEKTDSNTLAKLHTHLVEDILLEKSAIVRKAVAENKLYIANCHFHHSTGKVEFINLKTPV